MPVRRPVRWVPSAKIRSKSSPWKAAPIAMQFWITCDAAGVWMGLRKGQEAGLTLSLQIRLSRRILPGRRKRGRSPTKAFISWPLSTFAGNACINVPARNSITDPARLSGFKVGQAAELGPEGFSGGSSIQGRYSSRHLNLSFLAPQPGQHQLSGSSSKAVQGKNFSLLVPPLGIIDIGSGGHGPCF